MVSKYEANIIKPIAVDYYDSLIRVRDVITDIYNHILATLEKNNSVLNFTVIKKSFIELKNNDLKLKDSVLKWKESLLYLNTIDIDKKLVYGYKQLDHEDENLNKLLSIITLDLEFFCYNPLVKSSNDGLIYSFYMFKTNLACVLKDLKESVDKVYAWIKYLEKLLEKPSE